MTVVKDKTTGVKYRIFVDAYTLDVVPDKPATLTEPGVWSMYEHSSKNGVDKNLKEWQKSDQLTKFVEQETVNMGINASAPITEENMNKLSGDAGILLGSSRTLTGVPKYGQENSVYCGCASCQMIGKYICNIYDTQDDIYRYEGHNPNNLIGGLSDSDAEDYCKNYSHLSQRGTTIDRNLAQADAISEINNNRPFFSIITGHFRVCRGYSDTGLGLVYIYLIDPLPIGQGSYRTETSGVQEIKRIYVRP